MSLQWHFQGGVRSWLAKVQWSQEPSDEGMAYVQEDAPVGHCEEGLSPCEDGARSNQAWGKKTRS
jgi:hypothetical protein